MSKVSIPKIGYLRALGFLRNTVKYIDDTRDLGNYQILDSPLGRIHLVSNAQIIQDVFVRHEQRFEKSKIYWKELRKMIGPCLGTVEGDEWLWLKRLQQPYYNNKKVVEYLPMVLSKAQSTFESWESHSGLDVSKEFSKINISCVLATIFGIEDFEQIEVIADYIAKGEKIVFKRSQNPLSKYLPYQYRHTQSYLNFFHEFTRQHVEQNVNNKTISNLLDELIARSIYRQSDGMRLENIRNEIIVHLGASTETAAIAQTWTLYNLAQHPNDLLKVKNEIRQITNKRKLSIEDYSDLVFTRRAVMESLRMYPPSHAVIRDVIEDFEHEGLTFSRGDIFFASVYGLHRNSTYWRNPDDFIPSRFVDNDDLAYKFAPFGFGKHRCIGRHLALPMMVLIIASFIDKFEYNVINASSVKMNPMSTLKPAPSINVRINRY